MRTRIAAIATTAVLALMLSGCGDDTTANDETQPRAFAQSGEATPEPSESAPPLVAETPDAMTPDELFLADARERLAGLGAATTIPNATDEQLMSAGHKACDIMAGGTVFSDVTVIADEHRTQGSYLDSAAIASAGILFYCPELNGKVGR